MPSTENKVYDKKIAVNVNLSIVGFLRKKRIFRMDKYLDRANFGG